MKGVAHGGKIMPLEMARFIKVSSTPSCVQSNNVFNLYGQDKRKKKKGKKGKEVTGGWNFFGGT